VSSRSAKPTGFKFFLLLLFLFEGRDERGQRGSDAVDEATKYCLTVSNQLCSLCSLMFTGE